jgi:hypothetical protein
MLSLFLNRLSGNKVPIQILNKKCTNYPCMRTAVEWYPTHQLNKFRYTNYLTQIQICVCRWQTPKEEEDNTRSSLFLTSSSSDFLQDLNKRPQLFMSELTHSNLIYINIKFSKLLIYLSILKDFDELSFIKWLLN